jgi:dTDP-4-dehydrorhamnose reductase
MTGDTDAACATKADVAFVCAAMTNIQSCEADPLASRKINVTETVRLVERLVGEGSFVVFLSSNTVFDGQTPFPDEDAPCSPTTEYGRQKRVAEEQILGESGSRERVAVVRLSKVVAPANGMTADFLRRLRQGVPCPAFADLFLCPASLAYVGAGLAVVAAARSPGIFHLSGADEMSYAGFARHLAGRVGADPALVVPGNSAEAGASVLFRPDHPALGMARTRRLPGLVPEQTEQMLNALES